MGLVQNLDFAEAILDAAGAPIPGDMQGRSLLPLLTGKKVEWHDARYYHYYDVDELAQEILLRGRNRK